MTSVWMTVPNFAKVRHHKTDFVISISLCLLVLFLISDIKCNQHFSLYRWLLVQLLHRLKLEWCVLSLWNAHQEHRWHHLVRLAWTKLLPQTGGDEDPTPKLHSLV